MYNGSKGAKGRANHRKKCGEYRGSEQDDEGLSKGEYQGRIKGICRKNKRGKWEERKPTDRNMTPFLERQFHLSISGETF